MSVINAPSGHEYNEVIYVYLEQQDISKITRNGKVHVVFETPMFTVEWDM